MDALACGLDIGTTNLKVVLVDRHGRVRWHRAVETPRIADAAGPLSDPASVLSLLEDLVVAGWREVGGGVPLGAIAGAGVGEDGFLVDARLRPCMPCIPWFDRRAAAEAQELGGSSAASPRLGIGVDPARTAAKWLWHARRRNGSAPGATWVALTDYPAIAWSGRPFLSETLAARTAAYDILARAWHEPMLRAAQAPALPELRLAGSPIGPVTAERLLGEGVADARTLVVAGGHDHPVAASFIRRFEPRAIVDSMGTAELLYGERPVPAEPSLHPLVAFSVPLGPAKAMACLGVQELAAAMEPFRRSAHGDLLAPLLTGRPMPGAPSDARTLACAKAQTARSLSALAPEEAQRLARAAIEAAAFGARDMLATIVGEGPIFATGGWSRSDALMELRASIFGRPMHRMAEDELTGAGAALLALSATDGFDPAALRMPAVERFRPRCDWMEAYAAIGAARGA